MDACLTTDDCWYVLRDLARPNAKNPAYKQLQEMPDMKDCVFVPLKQCAFVEFGKRVDEYKIPYENRPEIFGRQLIMDEDDNIIGEMDNILSFATTLSFDEVPTLVESFGGICYPAHIDRQSNGIISVLGTFPATPHFNCVELHDSDKADEYIQKYGLQDKKIIVSSDAHNLTDMRDRQNYFDLDDEPYSSALVRKKLFELLR